LFGDGVQRGGSYPPIGGYHEDDVGLALTKVGPLSMCGSFYLSLNQPLQIYHTLAEWSTGEYVDATVPAPNLQKALDSTLEKAKKALHVFKSTNSAEWMSFSEAVHSGTIKEDHNLLDDEGTTEAVEQFAKIKVGN
jgi:hypothetical protein